MYREVLVSSTRPGLGLTVSPQKMIEVNTVPVTGDSYFRVGYPTLERRTGSDMCREVYVAERLHSVFGH